MPSLLGGALGAVLLLRTEERVFSSLAPFLVLFATVLFLFQGVVSRWTGTEHTAGRTPVRLPVAWLFQFGVGIYGGYFGAGIGILMLATLASSGSPTSTPP